mmetsp:Transcript_13062/g.24420  ORF Transcript_13062/g.24420 Transcript_13062/m.24420 type:complete len:88 (+) Transcript_13062:695-958(+)
MLLKVPNFPNGVVTSNEIPASLHSAVSISYKELCRNVLNNRKLQASIFGESMSLEQQEMLVQLSKEDLLTPDANMQPAKRFKGKKKR